MIGLDFNISDTIWIFKRHYLVINAYSNLDDFIKPIPHKVETLNFFYNEEKKVFNISTKRCLGSQGQTWYQLRELNKDYFLTEEAARTGAEKIKPEIIKQLEKNRKSYKNIRNVPLIGYYN